MENYNSNQTEIGPSYLGRMLTGETDLPEIQTRELNLRRIKVFVKRKLEGLKAKFEPDTERVPTNNEFGRLVEILREQGTKVAG